MRQGIELSQWNASARTTVLTLRIRTRASAEAVCARAAHMATRLPLAVRIVDCPEFSPRPNCAQMR